MNKITTGILFSLVFIITVILFLVFRPLSFNQIVGRPTPNVTVNPIDDSQLKTYVYVTFYGWNDNDPPGTAIAYPKNEDYQTYHNKAEGVGTYNDPVTFAADPKIFSPGTLIYVPYIKKYAIMEDWCAGCIGNQQIDIWAGGDGNNPEELNTCEENSTRESELIILSPKQGFETDPSPIFNTQTTECRFY